MTTRRRLVPAAVFLLVTSVTGITVRTSPPSCIGLAATLGYDPGITDGDGRVSIIGTAGDDVIIGTAGDDAIDGGGGDDTICGGAGDDVISGGAGDDVIDGGPGSDRLDGGPGLDAVGGGDGADVVVAGDGNDVIDGGLGIDTLDGGGYDGVLDVDLDAARAEFTGGTTSGEVVLVGIETVVGTAGNDRLYGSNDGDNLYGMSGADVIDGRGGDDLVSGGTGDDTLVGGTGSDDLRGGPGNDTCTFGPTFEDCELPYAHAILDGAPAGLRETIEALAAWIVDRGNPQPDMPPGLAAHLAPLHVEAPFELTLDAAAAVIGIFTPAPVHPDADHPVPAPVDHTVAVATTGAGDVVLLVEDAPDSGSWRVVGTRLASVGSSAWYGPNERFVAVLGTDDRPRCPFPIADPGSYSGPCRPWRSNYYWENAADSIHLVTANVADRSGALVGLARHSVITVSPDYRPYHRESVANPGNWLPAGSVELLNDTMVVAVDPATGNAAGFGSPGGPATTAAQMARLTGLPIEGYLVTQFGGGLSAGPGMTELVDAFGALTGAGGLEITLAFPVNWIQANGVGNQDASLAHWPAGFNLLDGVEALRLARERTAGQPFDPGQTSGDYSRQYRGSLLIEAALIQAQRAGWLAIPDLLQALSLYVATDLDAGQLLTLAATAFELDPGHVVSMTAPVDHAAQELVTGQICQDVDGAFKPELLVYCDDANHPDTAYWRSIDWFDLESRRPRPIGDPSIPKNPAALWADLADGHLGP